MGWPLLRRLSFAKEGLRENGARFLYLPFIAHGALGSKLVVSFFLIPTVPYAPSLPPPLARAVLPPIPTTLLANHKAGMTPLGLNPVSMPAVRAVLSLCRFNPTGVSPTLLQCLPIVPGVYKQAGVTYWYQWAKRGRKALEIVSRFQVPYAWTSLPEVYLVC